MGQKRTWHCNSKLPISEMCPECQEKRREYIREYMRKTRKAAKLAATVADRWRD